MKKQYWWVVILLIIVLLAGCSGKRELVAAPAEPVSKMPTLVEEEPKEAVTTQELMPTRTPPPFCEDPRVMAFVEVFIWAIENEDADSLGNTITNRGGLNIRLEWWNTNVYFSKEEAVQLFEDGTVHDWGIADGSGAPVQGTFVTISAP